MATIARAMCVDGQCRPTKVTLTAPSNLDITATVGRDAPNRLNDVKTIQDALNQVPAAKGGPAKKLDTDGLCWGKTQAAIKQFQKEACGFKWPDVRVDPNGKTLNKLREFFVPANPYTIQLIYAMLPEAVRWINAARRDLGLARIYLGMNETYLRIGATPLITSAPFKRVCKYFHLDKQSKVEALASIQKIYGIFTNMLTAIGHHYAATTVGSGVFQADPREDRALAYTFCGGWTVRDSKTGNPVPSWRYYDDRTYPNIILNTIVICPRTLAKQPASFYPYVIIHELAHYVGPGPEGNPDEITDHSYRWRHGFFKLSPYQALRTADCYSQFAADATPGVILPSGW